MHPSITNWIKLLGPGLLYAGAAVGVSHLVQSTKAGAQFGSQLVWAILLANLVKYPFFQIGPRYTAATGNSLLEGYKRLGNWALVLVFVMTITTMFTIQAAVTIVTAGLAIELTGIVIDPKIMTIVILLICALILGFGRYALLDRLIKYVILLLSVTTVVAVLAAWSAHQPSDYTNTFNWANHAHILFLVALVGWMPAPLDVSIWHSIWSVEKNRELKTRLGIKEAMLDFNLGYIGTAFLSLCFVALGSFILYASGETLAAQAGEFASQLIRLYTSNLGDWAYWVIVIAAFMTMFSTSISCLDAFPRVLRRTCILLLDNFTDTDSRSLYTFWLVVTCVGSLVLLFLFIDNMKAMVTLATVISFVLAPIYAILNYMVIEGSDVADEYRITPLFKCWCWAGIAALSIFCLWFLLVEFAWN